MLNGGLILKKLAFLGVVAVIAYVAYGHHAALPVSAPATQAVTTPTNGAASAREISGAGTVLKILPDDDVGSRHQRFILRLASGQTLLVAHNIDIAPRITALNEGDTVEYKGEFAWNPKGGVVHWTHHDPAGQRQAGWLRHNGQTFQ